MLPRTVMFGLPTGRRVRVRADLSVRIMLRSRLIDVEDEDHLVNAIDGVEPDDSRLARRLQDAVVLHLLDERFPHVLDGLGETEYQALMRFAVQRLTATDDEVEGVEGEIEDDAPEAVEEEPQLSLEDELATAAADDLPSVGVPDSAKVLEGEPVEGEGA